jgi:hypothetical protein
MYRMAPSSHSTLAVQDVDSPEIADNTRESCTAQIIRLCQTYGRLIGDTSLGLELQRRASDAVGRFASATSGNSPTAAGYFCSALRARDDRFAVTVGPKAQQLADELFARAPTRLVAPAFDRVRKDLQKRAPGVYVVRGPQVAGPLTVDQAAKILPATFAAGGPPLDISGKSAP